METKTIKLNLPAYAKKMQVTKSAVAARIKKGSILPGVVSIEKILGFWVIEFDPKTNIKAAAKLFKKMPFGFNIKTKE